MSEVKFDAFHKICGANIVFMENRIMAHRNKSYNKGVVFSANPFPIGSMFQMKILDRGGGWKGAIRIGFTTFDPDKGSIPLGALECYNNEQYWILSEDTVNHKGVERKLDFSIEHLKIGDSIGCCVTKSGDLKYYVNGVMKGVGWDGLPTDKLLWGFADLYGLTRKVKSEFVFDPLKASLRDVQRNVWTIEGRLTQLEASILKDSENRSAQLQPQNQDLVDILQLKQQNQQQASQIEQQQLVQQDHTSQLEEHTSQIERLQQEHTSQIERLQQEHTSQIERLQQEYTSQLEQLQEDLTAHFKQQLGEQKRQIKEELQQRFQAQVVQLQSHMQNLQPSWSIDQENLEITERVLGRGAYGEVRVGIYQGTRVAVKKIHEVIISAYNRELFEREMKIASRVRHPNLVLFIGAVTTNNITIVSELMETSLRKVMEAEKLKPTDIRPISKDVACALVYLHSLPDPIVHCDVSSANVLLNAKKDGWQAKLGDFGSANFLAKL